MATRLTGEAARRWLAENPNATYINNKTGQTVARKQSGIEKFALGLSKPFRTGVGVAQEFGGTIGDLSKMARGDFKNVGKRPSKYALMSEEETQALQNDPLRAGLKSGIGVASFGIGGGAKAGATGLKAIGQAAGKGAIAGGLGGFGYSKEGEELGGTLKGAALGGLIGGALQGGSQAIGKLGQKTPKGKVNAKLVEGSASKIGKTPEEFTTDVTSLLDDMSKRGYDVSSSKSIANSFKSYLSEVGQEVDDFANIASGSPDLEGIRKLYTSNLKYIDNSSAAQKFKDITDDLLAKPNPTYGDIVKYTRELDKVGGGFKRVMKDGTNQLGQILKDVRGVAREASSASPEVVGALDTYSRAANLESTILKNPEIANKMYFGGILPISKTVNVRPLTEKISQTSQRIGDAMIPSAQTVGATQTIAGLGQRAIPGMVGASMLGEKQPIEQPVDQTPSQGLGQTQQPTYGLYEALNEASQMMPGASESEIMSLAKMLMEQNSPAGGAVAAKDYNNAMSGLKDIASLESMMNSTSLAPQILGQGNLSGLVGGQDYQIYQGAAKNVADLIARVRTGAQINEEEMRLYMKEFLPAWFEGPEAKQAKIDRIKSYFEGILSGQITPADIPAPKGATTPAQSSSQYSAYEQ